MSFSPVWLALREPVDHRARNRDIARQVAARFAGAGSVRVVDLGCGTGSNLRATAGLLPARQEWMLVDYDPVLLSEARKALTLWAGAAREEGETLVLAKAGRTIRVIFRWADLNADLDAILETAPDLVTASALFDLVSDDYIATFARKVAARRAAFYTVLTYDGQDAFQPPHPQDAAVIAAFGAHQGGDKGFGPAAGPRAADALGRAFSAAGHDVSEGDSPWRIGPDDAALATPLLDGIAAAVRETGRLPETAISDWLAFRQRKALRPDGLIVTGHRDTFAVPG